MVPLFVLFSLWISSQRSICGFCVSCSFEVATLLCLHPLRYSLCACPRGSSSKEPGLKRQEGPSTVWQGQSYPREIFDLISFSYSQYSPDHPLIFTWPSVRAILWWKTSLATLKQPRPCRNAQFVFAIIVLNFQPLLVARFNGIFFVMKLQT